MKIILDAMGGDHAPEAPVLGALQAAKDFGAQIILVGRGEAILEVMRKNGIDIRYAYQKQELPEGFEVPEGRIKPFGTGHAIMSAGKIDDNFGVVNADDCYGRDAFMKLASFLRDAKDGEKAHYCMVGYQVKNTLSNSGTVSRGVCLADENDYLVKVEEHKKIERIEDGSIINTFDDGSVGNLTEDTIVSMNCFGFTPSFCNNLYDMFVKMMKEEKKERLESITRESRFMSTSVRFR